jgi:hypothetical protein
VASLRCSITCCCTAQMLQSFGTSTPCLWDTVVCRLHPLRSTAAAVPCRLPLHNSNSCISRPADSFCHSRALQQLFSHMPMYCVLATSGHPQATKHGSITHGSACRSSCCSCNNCQHTAPSSSCSCTVLLWACRASAAAATASGEQLDDKLEMPVLNQMQLPGQSHSIACACSRHHYQGD